MDIYEDIITVAPEHIDMMNHVNNVVYVQWIQDIALAHWQFSASKLHQDKYAWVALRHEVDYKSPGFLNDEILIRTWIEENEGAKSYRIVKISRVKDQKLLVQAKTTWCLINRETLRPARIAVELKDLFGDDYFKS